MAKSLLKVEGRQIWFFWILVNIGDEVFRAVIDTRETLSILAKCLLKPHIRSLKFPGKQNFSSKQKLYYNYGMHVLVAVKSAL